MKRCGLWRVLLAELRADPFEAVVIAAMAFVLALGLWGLVVGWDEPVAAERPRLCVCVNPRPRG